MSDERVVITPLKDGPNQIAGGVVVQDPDGNVIKEASIVYLRVGAVSVRTNLSVMALTEGKTFTVEATCLTHSATSRKPKESA